MKSQLIHRNLKYIKLDIQKIDSSQRRSIARSFDHYKNIDVNLSLFQSLIQLTRDEDV